MCGSEFYITSKAGASSPGGSSAFSAITGSPNDNVELNAALNNKQDVLGYDAENIAAKNQPDGYVGLNSTGEILSRNFKSDGINPVSIFKSNTDINLLTIDNTGVFTFKKSTGQNIMIMYSSGVSIMRQDAAYAAAVIDNNGLSIHHGLVLSANYIGSPTSTINVVKKIQTAYEIELTTPANGIIMKDVNNGNKYKLTMKDGILTPTII